MAKKLLKLLIISPYPIFPLKAGGGKIRIYEISQELAKLDLEITVLTPISFAQHQSLTINSNLKITVIRYPFLIPFLFTDRPFPYQFLVSFHPGYRFKIMSYLRTHDVIQFEHASFADLVDFVPADKIVIYDAHNVEYDYVSSECQNNTIRALTEKRIFCLENKLVQRANGIMVCSEEDRLRLFRLYKIQKTACIIAPNGTHPIITHHQQQMTDGDNVFQGIKQFKHRAIFSGSNVAHNRKAVHFIVNYLSPQMRSECAFIINGPCGKRFQHIKQKNIFFDVTSKSASRYAEICTVGLNPVMQGSGTSLKVLDYLVCGLPVVSTEFGMRGYHDLKKFSIICPMEQFPEAIRDGFFLQNSSEGVLEKYYWSNIANKIRNFYISLLQSA